MPPAYSRRRRGIERWWLCIRLKSGSRYSDVQYSAWKSSTATRTGCLATRMRHRGSKWRETPKYALRLSSQLLQHDTQHVRRNTRVLYARLDYLHQRRPNSKRPKLFDPHRVLAVDRPKRLGVNRGEPAQDFLREGWLLVRLSPKVILVGGGRVEEGYGCADRALVVIRREKRENSPRGM
jgi:hypothetical protein